MAVDPEESHTGMIWVVQVVREDGGDFLCFSSEEMATDFAMSRDEPCVISTRILDNPDIYYGIMQ